MDGPYWKGDRTMSTNEWLLTSDFWQFLEPWHGRWYEYETFIASCTYNIYDLENERWLLGDMIDHVGIYGSRVAEGLSASNIGLVCDYAKQFAKRNGCEGQSKRSSQLLSFRILYDPFPTLIHDHVYLVKSIWLWRRWSWQRCPWGGWDFAGYLKRTDIRCIAWLLCKLLPVVILLYQFVPRYML